MTSQLLTATAAATPDPATLIALAVLAWIGWQLLLIALFPYAPCRSCHGSGKHRSGQYFRPCRRCRGTGRRIRLGRHIWHWATRSRERT